MKRLILRFLGDERGATAVEYGLICAMIFLVILSAVVGFSESITDLFARATTALVGAMSNG